MIFFQLDFFAHRSYIYIIIISWYLKDNEREERLKQREKKKAKINEYMSEEDVRSFDGMLQKIDDGLYILSNYNIM